MLESTLWEFHGSQIQCRNRCLAGIITLGFIHKKRFNILLREFDPESEGLMALVITRPGKSFVPPPVCL